MKQMIIMVDDGIVTIDGIGHDADTKGVHPDIQAIHWFFEKDFGIEEHRHVPGNKPWEKGDENIEFSEWEKVEPFFKQWKEQDDSPDRYDPAVKGDLARYFSQLGNLESAIIQRTRDGIACDQLRKERDDILRKMEKEGYDRYEKGEDSPYKGLAKDRQRVKAKLELERKEFK